jgi:hypothetical protein
MSDLPIAGDGGGEPEHLATMSAVIAILPTLTAEPRPTMASTPNVRPDSFERVPRFRLHHTPLMV